MMAPVLLAAEASNALYRSVIRGVLPLSQARSALTTIFGSGLQLIETVELPDRSMVLAERLDRAATYDCYFLALAESLDCELWTGDERFYNGVRYREPRVRWIGEFEEPPGL